MAEILQKFSVKKTLFLFLKRLVMQTCKKQGLFGKGLMTPQKRPFEKGVFPQHFQLTLSSTYTRFNTFKKTRKLLEKTVEKGEIAQNEQFHIFPQCFLCSPYLKVL